MNSAPRPSVRTGRQSWRQPAAGGRTKPQSRLAARWITTLLTLLLVAALLYVIYKFFEPSVRTHLGAIAVSEYDPVVVEPLRYVAADVDALQELEKRHLRRWDRSDWRALQESAGMPGLGVKLRAMEAAKKDAVVIHIAAHGVSDDGTAYILCSDYMRGGAASDQRRFAVSELIAQLGQSPAGLKLLVLDCGRIGYDSRLAMTPNEFAPLVATAVEAAKDPALWVLLSHGPLQTTSVANAERQSLFGQALAGALRGGANARPCGNADLYLTLDELYRYLWNHALSWSSGAVDSGQIPQLMHAGQGIVAYDDIPADLLVMQYSSGDPQPESEPTGDAKDEKEGEHKRNPQPRISPTKKGAQQTSRSLRPAGAFPVGGLALAQATAAGDQSSAAPAADAIPAQGAAGTSGAQSAPSAAPPAAVPEGATAPPAASTPELAPSAAPGTTAPNATTAPPPEQQGGEALRALSDAWAARDRLRSRAANGRSPIDFAPHLWRQIDAILLDYESRLRDATRPEIVASELRLVHEDLQQLSEDLERDQPPRPPRNSSQTFRDLVRAWDQYRSHPASTTFDAPELAAAAEASRALQDAIYDAVFIVRLQQRSFFTQRRIPQYREVVTLLDRVAQLQQSLRNLDGEFLTDFYRQELQQRTLEVREARTKLLQQWISSAARAEDQLQRPLAEREVEDLLATPLLEATFREPLLAELLKSSRSLPVPLHYDLPTERPSPGPTEWTALWQAVDLERRLIGLVDAATAEEIERRDLDAISTAQAESLVIAHRRLGQKLQQFYERLPERIRQASAAGEEHAAGDALLLVDARDAARVAIDPVGFHKLHVLPVPLAPTLALNLEQAEVALSIDQTSHPRIELVAERLQGPSALVQLQFDERALKIQNAGREIRAGEPFTVALADSGTTSLPLELLARRYRQPSDAAEVQAIMMQVHVGEQETTGRVSYQLPLPNQVDLVVQRIGASQPLQNLHEGLRVNPFPNRPTSFQLSLVNRSGEEKNVRVELIAVPKLANARWSPGTLLDRSQAVFPEIRAAIFDLRSDPAPLRPGVAPLFTVDALTLPPGRLVDLDLLAKKDAPAEAGAAPPVAPPADATAPLPAADVSQGLVLLVTNVADAKERWVRWIEIDPLAPKNYLREQVRYDAMAGEISIELVREQDTDGDGLGDEIPQLVEQPVEARLSVTGDIPASGRARTIASLPASQDSARLFVAAPPDGRAWQIQVDVDGYPRAFVYEVATRPGFPAKDVRQNLSQVQMLSVAPRYDARQLELLGLKDQPGATAVEETGQQLAFRPCEQLLVELAVDAPENAFLTGDADEFILLSLNRQEELQRLYSDRQVTTRLVRVAERGFITLESTVGDYQLPVEVRGMQNIYVDLSGQLVTQFGPQPPPEDWVRVMLDATPPALNRVTLDPQRTAPGRMVTVTAFASDEHSGVSQVEAGLDVNGNGIHDPDELKAVQSGGVLQIDTKDLRTGRTYDVIATVTDRVGWKSKPTTTPLAIIAPPATPQAPAQPQRGVVRGRVLFRGVDPVLPGRVRVSLDGSGQPPQEAGANGSFEFTNVLIGPKYKLSATGTHRNMLCEGTLEAVEAVPRTDGRTVTLRVDKP